MFAVGNKSLVAFDLADHYSWETSCSEWFQAKSEGNLVAAVLALRRMAVPMGGEGISKKERQERTSVYSLFRDMSGDFGRTHTPDFQAIQEAWNEQGNHWRKTSAYSIQNRPVQGDAFAVYQFNGRPRNMELYVSLEDIQMDNSQASHQASWRYVLRSAELQFLPGEKRILLITTSELGPATSTMFDCCGDGDNVYGTAGRAFSPYLVDHQQVYGSFFELEDFSKFELHLPAILERLEKGNIQEICLMLGWRDIKAVIQAGMTTAQIFEKLMRRLQFLVAMTGRRVIFGGLLQLGGQEVEKMIEQVHALFFHNALYLREFSIFFFDCSSPSPLADLGKVYNWEGDFTNSFKAVALFCFGRAIALFEDNLWTPCPLYGAGPAEVNFVRFASARRGQVTGIGLQGHVRPQG